ncbi:MAG: GDSL-type esterase/lipase family protein [Patescibacteria group bacterium]
MKKATLSILALATILFGITIIEVHAQTADATVTVTTPGPIQPGQYIDVSWSLSEEDHRSRDWIGLYKSGATNSSYLNWKYAEDPQGSASLYVPRESGTYEIRYMSRNGFTSIAKSSSFTVGTGTDGGNNNGGNNGNATTTSGYSLTLSSTNIQSGQPLQVSWKTPDDVSISRDWIAVFKSNSQNNNYLDWAYTSGNREGTLNLYPPKEAGSYEVRYLKKNGYTSVAEVAFTITVVGTNPDNGNGTTTPNPNPGTNSYSVTASPSGNISPGATVTISWTAPQDTKISRDWVGIFGVGTSNRQYYEWSYTNGRTGSVTLKAPTTEGDYEVRYLKNNGYTSVAKSAPFKIQLGSIPNNKKIIAFGDSLTAGFGATEGNDYVSVLSRRINQPIENAGVIGDTTAEALTRLETSVLSKNPDVVIILLGGNDVIQRVPRSETFENIKTIIERIKARGADVVLVGIHQTIYNSNYRSIANQTDSYFVPEVLSGILGRNDLTADLIHPNDAGYVIVAQRIDPVVRVALAQ